MIEAKVTWAQSYSLMTYYEAKAPWAQSCSLMTYYEAKAPQSRSCSLMTYYEDNALWAHSYSLMTYYHPDLTSTKKHASNSKSIQQGWQTKIVHTVTKVKSHSAGCTCEGKKSYKDVWMREWEEYCNDGWMFLNKRPTMMCLAKQKTMVNLTRYI